MLGTMMLFVYITADSGFKPLSVKMPYPGETGWVAYNISHKIRYAEPNSFLILSTF
jgi:hypothetical protein